MKTLQTIIEGVMSSKSYEEYLYTDLSGMDSISRQKPELSKKVWPKVSKYIYDGASIADVKRTMKDIETVRYIQMTLANRIQEFHKVKNDSTSGTYLQDDVLKRINTLTDYIKKIEPKLQAQKREEDIQKAEKVSSLRDKGYTWEKFEEVLKNTSWGVDKRAAKNTRDRSEREKTKAYEWFNKMKQKDQVKAEKMMKRYK